MLRFTFWNHITPIILCTYIILTTSSEPGLVKIPAGIIGKQKTVLIAELNERFEKWCLTYGDPPPEVNWFQIKSYGKRLVARGNLLQLRISYSTVGDYMCQANNSAYHMASWLVIIQAYQTEDVKTDNPHILPRLKIDNRMVFESHMRSAEKTSLVKIPAGIIGKQKTVLIAKLGENFEQWCLTYGEPPPEVNWFQIKNDGIEHVTWGNRLQLYITYESVGDYLCQASNSAGLVASWLVIIQAYQTDDVETDNPHILPRLQIENYKDTNNKILRTQTKDLFGQASNSTGLVASWLVIIQAYQTDDVETDNPHILPKLQIENYKDTNNKILRTKTKDLFDIRTDTIREPSKIERVPFLKAGNESSFPMEMFMGGDDHFTPDRCRLPIDTDYCAGYFSRWGFNRKTLRCEQFIWNGCGGNTNMFNCQTDCIKQCVLSSSPSGADRGTTPTSTATDDYTDYIQRRYYEKTGQDTKNHL